MKNKHVLVVEDDPIASHALSLIFKQLGAIVSVAENVTQGIRQLETESFDWMILDLMLPDGEGTELLSRVRAKGLATKVVVATASADDRLLSRVRAQQPEGLLRKPTDIRELLAVMQDSSA
jgi:DNA-binding response OmpR family regulator